MSTKNSSGIEPATFRFVAQHLNHCATAVPTGITEEIQTFQEKQELLAIVRKWKNARSDGCLRTKDGKVKLVVSRVYLAAHDTVYTHCTS